MYIVLTKTVGKRANLQKGTVHDWARRVIRKYCEQWGPQESWCKFISEEEAERLEAGTPVSTPSVEEAETVPEPEVVEEVVEEGSDHFDDSVPDLGEEEIQEEEKVTA